MEDKKPRTSLHWFRKNLRLHDNPALCEAIKESDDFLALYILPPSIPDGNISANRWNFLIECLEDLNRSLTSIGSRLLVVQGYPAQVIPKLLKCLHITKLTFESESEPFSKQRDAVITHLAESMGVEVVSCTSHTLYDVDKVLEANNNVTPLLFDSFLDVVATLGPPEPPTQTVSQDMMSSLLHKANMFGDCDIPAVEDLGIDRAKVTCQEIWCGGESEALQKLHAFLKELVDVDFQVESASELFLRGFTDKLSPYLRFGCLSPRTYYHALLDTYYTAKKQYPPQSLFFSLLWRDFYFVLGSSNPTLNQMENNPLCLQINWDQNVVALEKWKMGQTGFPFVDAIMRQLCKEGWISSLARQVVGSFLTQGCMWMSWEEGFKIFGELQLDAEWSLSAGSWLSISGSSFDQNRLAFFCPVETAKKLDPMGEYIRKYVPEVKDLPLEYVFEPWTAPTAVQEAAGCVLGRNYPLPLADHKEQQKVCMQRLKELAQNLGTGMRGRERGHTSVHLFRKDLRLHDNPSLCSCLEGSTTFYPVYVLDTEAARKSKISPNRWNFLFECLRDLDDQLAALGSRLFVVRGREVEVISKLIQEWGVTRISFESDSEPFGVQRDAVIQKLAEEAGVEVLSKTSHTLFSPEDIIHANHGVAPMIFEDFLEVLKDNLLTAPSPVKQVDRQLFGCCVTPVADHQANFGLPELSELGVRDTRLVTSSCLWKGGEQEALRRVLLLEKQLEKNDFEDEPLSADTMTSSPIHLSPYLRFGCLSPRLMWQCIKDTYWKAKGRMPPMSLFQPLLLREFFFTIAHTNPGLGKMDGNPFSIQFPWEENPEGLQRWKKGTTGFPWIDAVMRQLRQEGWIPHLARQAVGCFLTRGCLWINWEEGYKVFDELQLDAEWSLNVGNWLWLSGSAFVKGPVPWFCPVEVGKKIDTTGEYVKKYVPEVKHLPVKYLFEPWKAPLKVQKAARCIVGEDYPDPVADHIKQRIVCVQRLKDLCFSLDILGHTSLHWFRKDLRLHDNPSLRECLRNSKVFYGVYFLPPSEAKQDSVSLNRWGFLLESLRDLDTSLVECGSRLFVIRGNPVEMLPNLFKKWNINQMSFEVDSEPYSNSRDLVISHLAKENGIEVISRVSHTLYDPRILRGLNSGIVPLLFDEFKEFVLQKRQPENPVPKVGRKLFGACVTPVGSDHQQCYGVPRLDEIGGKFSKSGSVCSELYKGGESEALKRMETALQWMVKNDFTEPEITIHSLLPSATHLSPYLRCGCLSSRLLHQRITEEYIKAKGVSPPSELFDKLLCREFFFVVGGQIPDAHEMINNPISLEIPWEDSVEYLERWKKGTTGFPWIDAIMRQLRTEGWIHNIARRAVASFLTRGCLWVNWEEGFKVFDEFQLDAERSLNVGNWLWVSTSTFVKGPVPWFCPVGVGKKIDPTGEYVRKYVPEIRNLPTEYIFEPWLTPRDLQRSYGCVIGRDYPAPIVNHVKQRAICVQRMQELAFKLASK